MEDEKFQEFVIKHLVKLSEGQDKIRQDIARLEFEHGEKLSALFDGYQVITETLADHTERLNRIEEKLETHDIQIHILDKTKTNERKVK